jgi:integrase/recombinase XerD
MTPLRQALADYLRIRRRLGFKLRGDQRILENFVAFLEGAGADRITTEPALMWARLPEGAPPHRWRQRLGIVRTFARYLATLDPSSEVPVQGSLPARRLKGGAVYLLARRDQRADERGWFVDATVAGGRIQNGDRTDGHDRPAARRGARARPSRRRPHRRRIARPRSRAQAAGGAAAPDRDPGAARLRPPQGSSLARAALVGVLPQHARLKARQGRVLPAVREADRAGRAGGSRRARAPEASRPQALFAVRTLLDWYYAGEDVDRRMPELSTFLGHVDPASTYWYLEAVPELMALISRRLEQVPEALS